MVCFDRLRGGCYIMPIMRAPSGSHKTFKIPCSGEGIFVAVNTILSGGEIYAAYWNGTSVQNLMNNISFNISSITVQDGIATVIVYNGSGSYDSSTRVCFIPGNPLTSN